MFVVNSIYIQINGQVIDLSIMLEMENQTSFYRSLLYIANVCSLTAGERRRVPDGVVPRAGMCRTRHRGRRLLSVLSSETYDTFVFLFVNCYLTPFFKHYLDYITAVSELTHFPRSVSKQHDFSLKASWRNFKLG